MSAPTRVSSGCCPPTCPTPSVQNIPGPPGPEADPGAAGTNGYDAYSYLTVGFDVPAVGDNVTLLMGNSLWAVPGQVVFIQFAGYYRVVSHPDSTSLVVTNLGLDANALEGVPIPNASQVSPAGEPGEDGNSADALDDISPTVAAGDMLYDDGANAPASSMQRLPVGTNGKFLTVSGGLPSWTTLTSSLVAEGSNLYLTNARVIAALLTGFAASSGNVVATDSVLAALQRLEGRMVTNDAKATGADRVLKAGDTMTGALTVQDFVTLYNLAFTQAALTYAATTDIDFNGRGQQTLSLTGDVTFTTSNRAAGKSVSLKILADASIRNFTFPAWKFVGAAAPASIAANKTAILTLTSFGANDSDIVAAYAEEP
jgi:hypothetical protein